MKINWTTIKFLSILLIGLSIVMISQVPYLDVVKSIIFAVTGLIGLWVGLEGWMYSVYFLNQ